MFCYQCEQTAQGKGCTKFGVCGKSPEVAALQDLLIYAAKGIAIWGQKARELGIKDEKTDLFLMEILFKTVTNVDFDPDELKIVAEKAFEIKENLKDQFLIAYKDKNTKEFADELPIAAYWEPKKTMDGLLEQGLSAGIMFDREMNEDIRSLKELLTYGIKGMAAYADHAFILGKQDEQVTSFFYQALADMEKAEITIDELLGLNMKCGEINLRTMELLSQGHTERFGHPEPTSVSIGVKKGPAILISGHDLVDLEELLKQTEDKGIKIYTHGEMLPAHGYPELKKYKHLAGNYGGAWQDQQKEFAAFPGSILMTTNCIQKPADSYINNIFTTGLVEFPGVEHISDRTDFSKLINRAVELGGFTEDKDGKEILVGFGHNAVLNAAGKVIDLVKSGKIKHFYLVGGCDGAKPGRNYYTDFAEKAPKDTVLLTLACGKYRFNKLDFGDIEGIPRLLDIGQCNDAYSAIQIAVALANAFECGVNDLPLSMILSWYEQKAVVILLTLLYLGIKNIKLGPTLPAFLSPNVINVLVEKFNIAPISTPEADIRETYGA